MAALAASFPVATKSQSSPPAAACKETKPMDSFDLDMYISKKWYCHRQLASPVQPIEIMNCVTAEYSLLDSSGLPFEAVGLQNGYEIRVLNKSKDILGNVYTSDDATLYDGRDSFGSLCAAKPSAADSKESQFIVNGCVLPASSQPSNYWVLAYDEDEGMAVIATGQSTIPTGNGDGLCTYGNPFGGYFIFSRSPERNEVKMQKYLDILEENGIDTSIGVDVPHENCSTKIGKGPKKTKKSKKKKNDFDF